MLLDKIQELHRQLEDTRTQLSEELKQARDQIDVLQIGSQNIESVDEAR